MNVWLIGAGAMAVDYLKVLRALNCDVAVVGRGAQSARAFEAATGLAVNQGGIRAYASAAPALPDAAVVCVGVAELAAAAIDVIRAGVRLVLVEKPAALDARSLDELARAAHEAGARVFVAYNRRFFASVLHAKELIAQDGEVTSCHFEFTEWAHVVANQSKPQSVKNRWFLANSTHVVDLAFHLCGAPREMSNYFAGSAVWHPLATRFAGAGVTQRGALFSYCANWDAPGRWGVEVLTTNYRFILRPMEILQIMRKGSVEAQTLQIDDALDKAFKPGLYRQVERFLSGDSGELCGLHEHALRWREYCRIASYPDT